jgi:hypothetical protein
MTKHSYAPLVHVDEEPIEIDQVFVHALPTKPRTGIVRMCAKGGSQSYSLSTALMFAMCEQIVREGLQIETRAKRNK